MTTVTFTESTHPVTGERTGAFKSASKATATPDGNTVYARQEGIEAGNGLVLSPEQAAQYGYLDVPEGKTAAQAARDLALHMDIHNHVARQHGLNPDGSPLQEPQGPAPLSAEQKQLLEQMNEHRRLLGRPELTEAEYRSKQTALSASRQALDGDPDAPEAVPYHYTAERIDPQDGHVVGQFQQYFNAAEQNALLDMAIDGRELPVEQMSDLLRNHGMSDPSQLHGNIQIAMDVHEEAFDRYCRDRGVDGDAFREWVRENHADKVNAFARQQFMRNDPRVWSQLVTEYASGSAVANADVAMDALQRAGIPAWKSGKEVIVKVDGMEMTLKQAFKLGILTANWS